MSFDLDDIQDNLKLSFELEITHPTTGAGGWFVELATRVNAEAQGKVAAIFDRMKRRKSSTPSQDEADAVALIAAHVLGWRGLVSGGTEVPYSHETAVKILAGPKAFWLREQMLAAIGDPTKPFLS